jgi:hypothetical protein
MDGVVLRAGEGEALFGGRGGKMIGGFSNDEDAMVFKLSDASAREAALALDGAHLFDPSSGRRAPMKEWVVVPAIHAHEWPKLAKQALSEG